jgi:hypothetical protein
MTSAVVMRKQAVLSRGDHDAIGSFPVGMRTAAPMPAPAPEPALRH